MSNAAQIIAKMVDILPESEQKLAYEYVKALVLAWDPDFTKLTDAEAKSLSEAENSGFIEDSEIDWDHLEKYS